MPVDSREIERDRRERWLIRGVWLFQIVIGGGFWILVTRYSISAISWTADTILATGIDVTPTVEAGLALLAGYVVWIAFRLRN